MEFLSLSRRRSSARKVPSGEERGETDVFAGYSSKYFVGLFVVNKRVHFVVVICLVHNNSHPSLVCGSMTMLSSVFSRLSAFCSLGVKLRFSNDADCKVEVTLLLMLSLVDSDSSCARDKTASTLDTVTSVGICLGVTECLSP